MQPWYWKEQNDEKEAYEVKTDSVSDKTVLEDEVKSLKYKIKALEIDKKALKSDLAERSNLYCWHCGFELKRVCPRCGYGMTDTAYRDTETESNEESDEDNAQWGDKDYEDVDDENS